MCVHKVVVYSVAWYNRHCGRDAQIGGSVWIGELLRVARNSYNHLYFIYDSRRDTKATLRNGFTMTMPMARR